MGIRAFVPPQLTGRDFTRMLLQSPDFEMSALKALAGPSGKGGKSKDKLAFEVEERLLEREVSPEEILSHYVLKKREWFSLRLGSPITIPTLRPPGSLLERFGEEQWYGPIAPSTGDQWYIRPFRVLHFQKEEKVYKELYIRWLLFARVRQDAIVYTWQGFTRRTAEQQRGSQFPFWQHAPHAIEELEELVGGTWASPNLHKLTLHTLWEKYLENPGYDWQHLRIRAAAQGVVLNARSSGVSEVDIRGLEALTQALSKSALRALGQPENSTDVEVVSQSLTRTLMKEWGANSYELSIKNRLTDEQLFKAHCYFGLKTGTDTQDSFQHIKSYIGSGGAERAADFLLSESKEQETL